MPLRGFKTDYVEYNANLFFYASVVFPNHLFDPMMKKTAIFLSAFILVLAGCQKHEWNNLLDDKHTVPPPDLSFMSITDITQVSAVYTGMVEDNQVVDVAGVGISLSLTEDFKNDTTLVNKDFRSGQFFFAIKGLKPDTKYNIRAFVWYVLWPATTRADTVFEEVVSFTTLNVSFGSVVDVDGNIYKTTQIGSQIWMAENLKVTRFNDGTEIPYVSDDPVWKETRTPAYCWANGDTANKAIYGALYNYYAIHASKNICPAGWHIPNYEELYSLISILGGEGKAGGILKEEGTAHWNNPNTGASNDVGFSALPGGYRLSGGPFSGIGSRGYFWLEDIQGLILALLSESGSIHLADGYPCCDEEWIRLSLGASVRCVRDSTVF